MRKITYLLTAFAVLLFVLIAARVESKIFTDSPNQKRIQAGVATSLKSTQESRSKLEVVYAVTEDPKQFVLVDPMVIQEQQQLVGGQAVQMDSLHVTGAMTSDGVWSAIVNGSIVRPGDSVRGCEVIDVDKSGVVFLIDEQEVQVPVYEEYQFKMIKADLLALEDVVPLDGSNAAIINGRPYKVGDWIDGETQVKAIAPSVVMLLVKGKPKMLKVGQSL